MNDVEKSLDPQPVVRDYISASQMNMYMRCPEQYRRRYCENEIIPPGVAMVTGSSFHKGVEENMRQKVETHSDLPADDVVEIAVADFEKRVAEGVLLTKDEESKGKSIVIGRAKDDLACLARGHAEHQSRDYQPIEVERRVRIPMPVVDLLGYIDLIDDQDRIIDFKTTSRRKPQSESKNSIQLTVYHTAYERAYGVPPQELRLDCLVKSTSKVERQVLSSTRSREDIEALKMRVEAIYLAIQSGSFPPTDPNNWWCSERFCGYWHDCPYRPRTT